MAESAYLPGLASQNSEVLDSPRHSAVVRVTHWIHALSFVALVVSGIAILLAHTRFYWGETGGEGGSFSIRFATSPSSSERIWLGEKLTLSLSVDLRAERLALCCSGLV
jgi:Prokaryotic cytochrome b561